MEQIILNSKLFKIDNIEMCHYFLFQAADFFKYYEVIVPTMVRYRMCCEWVGGMGLEGQIKNINWEPPPPTCDTSFGMWVSESVRSIQNEDFLKIILIFYVT